MELSNNSNGDALALQKNYEHARESHMAAIKSGDDMKIAMTELKLEDARYKLFSSTSSAYNSNINSLFRSTTCLPDRMYRPIPPMQRIQQQLISMVSSLVNTLTNLMSQVFNLIQGMLTKPPVTTLPSPNNPGVPTVPTQPPVCDPTPPITQPSNPECGTTPEPTPTTEPNTGTVNEPAPQPKPSSLVPTDARILKATGEMLWNPEAKKDGNAVITFREALKDKVASLQILSADGTTVIGNMVESGIKDGKPYFRLDNKGSEYPKGAIVLITLKNGESRYVEIPNPTKQFKW